MSTLQKKRAYLKFNKIQQTLVFCIVKIIGLGLGLFFTTTVISQTSDGLNVQQNAQNKYLTSASSTAVFGEEGNNNSQSPFDFVKGKNEDLSKRDLFSKHYLNDDGSFTALIGAGPIHYESNGIFLDIDHTIQSNASTNYPFANKTNLFESYFGASAHQGVKNITPDGEIKEFLNTKMYWEINGQQIGTIQGSNAPVSVNEDRAYYPNLFGSVSAEFITFSGKRKLNYIIPTKNALGTTPINAEYLVFSEEIKLPPGLQIVEGHKIYNKIKKTYETHKGIYIINKNNNALYAYTAPNIVESYSSKQMGIPVQMQPELSFKEVGNSIIIYTKVKANWISDDARVFPIAIDPTVTVNPFTTTFSSGQTYSSGGGDGDIAVGYSGGWYRGWTTFNLTSLPSLSNVTAATMSLYIGNKGGTMGGAASSINIGHSKYDLSRLIYLSNYGNLYSAITNPNNGFGAYNFMPNQNIGTWATVNLKPATSNLALTELERKSGNDMAFFPVSFSPSWATGTTTRFYVIAGYTDINKPYLTITYDAVDKYCHSAHMNANTAGFLDEGYIGISKVAIGTINSTTTYTDAPTGYNRFNLTTNVAPASTYTLSVTYRDLGANSGDIGVWVDWNEDGDFADANEFIGITTVVNNTNVRTFNITVPTATTAGTKRLRVRSSLNGEGMSASDYCTTMEYGETEDYNLKVATTLPVILTNFSATCDDVVTLNWTTASEQNSDRFVIEKSQDGETWRILSEQTAAGNSNTINNYSQLDENNSNGVTYYRLKQIDFNGEEAIYGPISVSCEANESNMAVYPNPNNGTFIIEIASAEMQSDANLVLTDITGKIIVSQKVNITVGKTQIMMDNLDLQKGTYLIQIRNAVKQLKPVKLVINR